MPMLQGATPPAGSHLRQLLHGKNAAAAGSSRFGGQVLTGTLPAGCGGLLPFQWLCDGAPGQSPITLHA